MKLLNDHNPLPMNAERCIWMDAGQISYKLCDRSFECEGCPFDGIMQSRSARKYDRFTSPEVRMQSSGVRVPAERPEPATALPKGDLTNLKPEMRGIEKTSGAFAKRSSNQPAGQPLTHEEQFEQQLENLLRPFTQVRLPTDRRYTRDHLWVQEESRDLLRFGLDHLGVTMFSSVSGVVFSQTPSRVERGAPCVWIVHPDGAQAMAAPMTGTLLYANRASDDLPTMLTKFPYTDGWMMTLAPERSNTRGTGLMEPDDAADHFAQQGQVLRVALRDAYSKMRPAVGLTLNDGGSGNLSVPQMLGLSTYYRIVHKYFYAP